MLLILSTDVVWPIQFFHYSVFLLCIINKEIKSNYVRICETTIIYGNLYYLQDASKLKLTIWFSADCTQIWNWLFHQCRYIEVLACLGNTILDAERVFKMKIYSNHCYFKTKIETLHIDTSAFELFLITKNPSSISKHYNQD